VGPAYLGIVRGLRLAAADPRRRRGSFTEAIVGFGGLTPVRGSPQKTMGGRLRRELPDLRNGKRYWAESFTW
jgi:hypothetical protein